jgi:transposase
VLRTAAGCNYGRDITQFRRIATRYDKLAERFVSFISLVAAIVCSA